MKKSTGEQPARDLGVEYTYNNVGLPASVASTFDPQGSATVLDARTYAWDGNYNKTQQVIGAPFNQTRNYTYDSVNRLVQATKNGSVIDYVLDGLGNRVQVTGDEPGEGEYAMNTPDAAVNQYTLTPSGGQVHDPNGNLIRLTPQPADGDGDGDVDVDDYADFADCYTGVNTNGPLPGECDTFDFDADADVDLSDFGVFQFAFGTNGVEDGRSANIAYDYRNRMVRYEDLETAQVHLYDYDALNRRIRKVVDSGGPDESETRYYYSLWQIVQERTPDGTIRAHYLYGRYIDEPLAMRRDLNTNGYADFEEYLYLPDEQYNVVALVDKATGQVVERYDYSDYGLVAITDASSNALTESAFANPYMFTGRRYDPETGLYYYRHRHYDPITGRFTSGDPLGYADGLNLYQYVSSSPQVWADPLGLAPNQAQCFDYNELLKKIEEWEEDGLSPEEILARIRDEFGGRGPRYIWMDAYGWVDLRHFGEAARIASDWGSVITEVLGLVNEVAQWADETAELLKGNEPYRSGFSPEDLPSNAAGGAFGDDYIEGSDSLSKALEDFLKAKGARPPSDPETRFDKLPATDPAGGGAAGGSNSSNNRPGKPSAGRPSAQPSPPESSPGPPSSQQPPAPDPPRTAFPKVRPSLPPSQQPS